MKNKDILKGVASYYTDKILENGRTPQGVDWNSEESQHLRFEVLSTLIHEEPFSILDYGCGFGSMLTYYKKKYSQFNFIGFDISEEMIKNAKELFKDERNAQWVTELDQVSQVDYVIASGIFNVKMNNSDQNWLDYILDTLAKFDEKSRKGFAFNMLTKYSDIEYMKDYLHYADPLFIFDQCKKKHSKWVALKHDYPLYEFSIIVRK